MRKFVSLSILVAVILFWFAFAIHNALARPADFDPTFGTNGKLVTSVTAGGPAQINKVIIQPDGKIVAVGWAKDTDNSPSRIALVRYLENGSLDPSFGIGGKVFTTVPGGVDGVQASDAVIQSNGRIVVVGALLGSTNGYSTVVTRYNSNGSLDASFSGDGILSYNYDSVTSDFGLSVALQPDGKIVIGGAALTSILGPAVSYSISRLNSNGSFDTTFNTVGKRLSEFGLLTSGNVKIGIQPDGKIVAAGPGGDGTHYDFAVQRFNANGSPDGFFGNGGRVYTSFNDTDIPRTLTMLPDGRFIVGGESGNSSGLDSLMVVRYNPNGTRDTTFGFAGFLVQDIAPGLDVVESIVVQPNGKTVIAGRTSGSNITNDEFLVVRYLVNGLADPSFGTNGVKKFAFGAGDDHAYSIALQADGRMVAAGAASGQTVNGTFAVARLLGRGTAGDYDNDGVADLGVFRPTDGTWYLNRSNSGYIEYPFGISTDRPLVGDFDGDGESDVAVFRPSNGRWYVLRSSAGYLTLHFGLPGDIPTPADFDGDEKADIAVFRPSTGTWYCLKSSTNFSSSFAQQFGLSGDKPVEGDYDRDGRADLAVYRPSDSVWYVLGSTRGFYAARFGLSTDIPAPADFDGDSVYDIAVYRPSDGVWHVLRSSDGSYQPVRFGVAGDIPQPADFDLDGRSDLALFRPSTGVWHILHSSDGSYRATGWGLSGDRPMIAPLTD